MKAHSWIGLACAIVLCLFAAWRTLVKRDLADSAVHFGKIFVKSSDGPMLRGSVENFDEGICVWAKEGYTPGSLVGTSAHPSVQQAYLNFTKNTNGEYYLDSVYGLGYVGRSFYFTYDLEDVLWCGRVTDEEVLIDVAVRLKVLEEEYWGDLEAKQMLYFSLRKHK